MEEVNRELSAEDLHEAKLNSKQQERLNDLISRFYDNIAPDNYDSTEDEYEKIIIMKKLTFL